jgi:beta-lactamase regulating signal transducer with metallopeptidase domain
MTLFAGLTRSTVVLQLGWTLLHFLWQGAAIGLALSIALLTLRRRSAQARYVAGCTALLVMASCPLLTLACVRIQSAAEAAHFTAILATLPTHALPRAWLQESFSASQVKPINSLESLLPGAVVCWLAGVFILAIRALGGWLVVRRICRSAIPVGRDLAARAADLARTMGIRRALDVRITDRIQVPSVVGCFRSVILFPVSALTGLSTPQLEALLAHELAHVRRHDYLVNLLQTAVETLFFYHPAVWWVSRRIRAEREHCCDDIALTMLGDHRAYASALASLEELRQNRLALAAAGGELLSRIRRILGEPIMQTVPTNRPAVLLAAALALSLLAAPFALPKGNAEPKPISSKQSTSEAKPQADPFADKIAPARREADDVEVLKARIRELEEDNVRLRSSLSRQGRERAVLAPTHRGGLDVLRAEEADLARAKADLERQAGQLRASQAEKEELIAEARKQEAEAHHMQLDVLKGAKEQELHALEMQMEARRRTRGADMAPTTRETPRAEAGATDMLRARREATSDEIRALREENRAIRQMLEELRHEIEELRTKRGATAASWERLETTIEGERNDIQREVRKLLTVYSASHPKVKELQDQLAILNRQLTDLRDAQDRALVPSTPAP